MPSGMKTGFVSNIWGRWSRNDREQVEEDPRQIDYARMRELAMQGGKATLAAEIDAIDAEFTQLIVKLFSTS